MALIFLFFWEENLKISSLKNKFWFSLVVIAGFAATIGVGWEIFEFLLDWVFPRVTAQPSVADTVADLFFDFLGGMAVWFFYSRPRLYKEPPFNK